MGRGNRRHRRDLERHPRSEPISDDEGHGERINALHAAVDAPARTVKILPPPWTQSSSLLLRDKNHLLAFFAMPGSNRPIPGGKRRNRTPGRRPTNLSEAHLEAVIVARRRGATRRPPAHCSWSRITSPAGSPVQRRAVWPTGPSAPLRCAARFAAIPCPDRPRAALPGAT